VFLAKIHDSGSCRELGAKIFGEYLSFGVLIISQKFRLKTPSGLGDASIESLGIFGGLFFCPAPDDPEVRAG
jgi:hypothetical protein